MSRTTRIVGIILSWCLAEASFCRMFINGGLVPGIIGCLSFLAFVWFIFVRRLKRIPEDATEKAYRLLLAHLDTKQRREFRSKGSFVIEGSDGRLYRIHKKWAYGITTGDHELCAHPRHIPIYDSMLAQKLLLETNASHLHNIAYTKRR